MDAIFRFPLCWGGSLWFVRNMSGLLLANASKVVDAFGYFPVFHDAEIIELHLYRNVSPQENYPTERIEFSLHGWELTSEITEAGTYRTTKHHWIKFRFDQVDAVDLHHFNHQNVLFELIIREIPVPTDHARMEVEFSSSYGLEGGFRAVKGGIVAVEPCDESGFVL